MVDQLNLLRSCLSLSCLCLCPHLCLCCFALYKDAWDCLRLVGVRASVSFALTGEGVPDTPLPPGPLLSVLPAYEAGYRSDGGGHSSLLGPLRGPPLIYPGALCPRLASDKTRFRMRLLVPSYDDRGGYSPSCDTPIVNPKKNPIGFSHSLVAFDSSCDSSRAFPSM
ncbi:hypothetical protein Droror1_Dr00017580 [Drosera rotundifolia]